MTTTTVNANFYLRHIWNEWSPFLSSAEMRVVLFIFMRTYMFGKTEEKITITHFVDGVVSGSNLITAPTGLTKKWVIETVKNLQKKGLLSKIQLKNRSFAYTLNVQISGKFLKENLLNAQKTGGKKSVTRCNSVHHDGITEYTSLYIPTVYYKKGNLKGTHYVRRQSANICKKEEEEMVDMEKLKSVTSTSKQKTKKAREEKISKFSSTSVWSVWEDSFLQFYSKQQSVGWRNYEAKHIYKLLSGNFTKNNFRDFLHTVVAEWNEIISTELRFVKNKPAVPTIGLVIKFFPEFVSGYNRVSNIDFKTPATSTSKTPRKESTVSKNELAAHNEIIDLRKKLNAATQELHKERVLRHAEKNEQQAKSQPPKRIRPVRKLRLKSLPEWE